jgi:RimJ/RimL family protein N-acetyltransferase
MEFRKLTTTDTQQFCDLIVDMYSHLENLEWFSPMPFDYDNVRSMIENPRFYILGVFDGKNLCAVSSLDYKCGKLIGKIPFPADCNTNKLVEIGFTIVKHEYRGNGIMKKMVQHLLEKIKNDGFEWAFAKVHKDNMASAMSLMKNDFYIFEQYEKPVKICDFVELSSKPFFCPEGKKNATATLSKYSKDATEIIVHYNILMKKI